MKFSGSQLMYLFAFILLVGMNSQIVLAGPPGPGSGGPPPSSFGGPSSPYGSNNVDCTIKAADAQGAVQAAKNACSSWAKSFKPKKAGAHKASDKTTADDDNDEALSAQELEDFNNAVAKISSSNMTDADLNTCQEEYETKGSCDKMPTKDADSDDADAEDNKVYDPDSKSPANSPACKAEYAKKFAADKKADFDIMDKAETKSNDAQKALADAMMDEQTKEADLNNRLQAVMPTLQAKLMQLRESMTKEQQVMRDRINEILGQIDTSNANIKSLNAQIADLVNSYTRSVSNLFRDCKLRIKNSDPGGGPPVANMNFLTTCVNSGGLGNCKCQQDNEFLEKAEGLRNDDQSKLTSLRAQVRAEGTKIANLQNSLTNSQTNISEDDKIVQDKIMQETQAANTQAMQLNKQLQQMGQLSQQNMARLQAQAKTAQQQYAEAKDDYNESSTAFKALKGYAGKTSSSDDDATGADPILVTIKKGVESETAAKMCVGGGGGDSGTSATAVTPVTPLTTGNGTGRAPSGGWTACPAGTYDVGFGCQPPTGSAIQK